MKQLGATALWVGPVFKQRGHLNTYHGYGIQDLLDVDPRFGTRRDLVDLVMAAERASRDPRHHLLVDVKHEVVLAYHITDTTPGTTSESER